jgi:lipid II isoglutaminyl synthase (glutamine-hydrolysing)
VMRIYDLATLLICKTTLLGMRLMGRHGAALPGWILETINPSILPRVLGRLKDGVVVVSGTNGKTTTTHIISEVLKRGGIRVFTNHSGSNMTRGILSSIVRYASVGGHVPFDIAVLEIDEAYAAKLAPVIRPRASVLLNVLRDQLDRFGEIDYTADLLAELAENTSGVVLVNGGDSRLMHRTEALSAKRLTFGPSNNLKKHYPTDDELHGKKVMAAHTVFDVELTSVKGPDCQIKHRDKSVRLRTSLAGWHNAINVTAAYALIRELYPKISVDRFTDVVAPYGRGEAILYKGCNITLQLVKNPAGFRITMDTLKDLPALIVINDAYADSRDVSWLWDVDVMQLARRPSVSVAGVRGYDMAVRLKYADINVQNASTDVTLALRSMVEMKKDFVVFLTYTAMLDVRTLLQKGSI